MLDSILEVGDAVTVKHTSNGWVVEKIDKDTAVSCVIVKVIEEGYIFQRPGVVGTYRALLKKAGTDRFIIAPAYLTSPGEFVF